jgi:magnesium transporter
VNEPANIEQTTLPFDPELGFALDTAFVAEVGDAIDNEDALGARALVEPLTAPDQAELFDQLTSDQRQWLADVLSQQNAFDSDVLAELSPEAAEDVVEALGAEKTAEALSELESDDAIHIIEDMSLSEQQEILEGLPSELRQEVEQGLTYPEESAGRLMRQHLVAVPEHWTVGDTIDFLRAEEELPENFYVIYAVDETHAPVGRLLLGTMLHHKRETPIAEIMNPTLYAVDTSTDQEEVAYLFRKYALVEAPVVDEDGMLVGTITVDDVVDVIQEEEEEDYLRAGGVVSQDFGARLLETVRARFGWLFVNLLTAIMAAGVISMFETTIEKIVALAVMMPMVASMGGNTGTQSVTVAVRAIAIKYLTDQNRWAYVRKEMFIGMINGAALGAIMAGGVYMFFHDIRLSAVMFMAALVNMALAGLFGALIPIIMHKRGIDPAISSGIFLTTITDCVGFFSFLGLATLILL